MKIYLGSFLSISKYQFSTGIETIVLSVSELNLDSIINTKSDIIVLLPLQKDKLMIDSEKFNPSQGYDFYLTTEIDNKLKEFILDPVIRKLIDKLDTEKIIFYIHTGILII